mmetsp:Transcript_59046/g.157137  ORF Transcript_59046/g.157137 Transcript_59046/m.157137 type:complete len:103 (-) Transcript_59046:220-528(-)
MACVFCFCRGRLPMDDCDPVPVVTASISTNTSEVTSSFPKNIAIDCSTTVPEDLYMELVNAGQEARQRGQHCLATRPEDRSRVLKVSATLGHVIPSEMAESR